MFAPILIVILVMILITTCFSVEADVIWNEWHVTSDGGVYSETDGVLTFSGDEFAAGPTLYKEFEPPQDDFEVSIDLKAETLGEINRDPLGAGEGFGFGFTANYAQPHPGIHFQMRARAGGQFLLVWPAGLSDNYGLEYDWRPFVYNSLGYNNGYDYWHPGTSVDRSNSTVQPDVWYTLKLKVQKDPFTVTGEVYKPQGNLLGSYTIRSINNLEFSDIKYFTITSWAGGTFYIQNITGIAPKVQTSLTISTDSSTNQIGSPVNIQGKLCDQNEKPLFNEPIVLSYTFAGADVWYPIGSAFTNQKGTFNVQWVNNASGAITLNAQWKGNSTYAPVNTNITLNFLPITNTEMFSVESNSTITSLGFNSSIHELSFNVSGKSGTSGYTKIFIAKSILTDTQDLTVQIDGKQIDYQLTETEAKWVLSFSYNHSTHRVSLYFPSNLVGDISQSNLPEWIVISVAIGIILLVGVILIGLKKATILK